MSTIDKAALIEQAALQMFFLDCGNVPSDEYRADPEFDACFREPVAATLPVIAKALLAPLRELHHTVVAYSDFAMTTGRRECVCGRSDCPTVRLLDAIELEVQP